MTLPPGRSLVAIGGGSGLPVLLRGLKHRVAGREALTAVVTMADDGGSSGRLRRDFGVLPPGDIRNCLAAVADDSDLLTRLFQYRFPGGEGLSGTGPKAGGPHYLLRLVTERVVTENTTAAGGNVELMREST